MTCILLLGKTGQLGWELERTLPSRGRVIALDRTQLELTDPGSIRKAIRAASPGIIVNAAAYTAVDKAESEPDLAMQINGVAPGVIAEEAKRVNALLIHYSTDYVFDGTKSAPYTEDDAPRPLNAYGTSKLAGERALAESGCAYVILRTSWVYAGRGGGNFVTTILRLAREKTELPVVNDQIGSPTWARALAEATGELVDKAVQAREATGIYHLAAKGYASRFDFAKRILAIAREISHEETGWARLRPITTAEYPLPAKRPLSVATSKDKIKRVFGIEMPDWEVQLRSFLTEFMKPENRRRATSS